MMLQYAEQAPSHAESPGVRCEPHSFQFGWLAFMKLECSAADGSPAQARDHQHAGRRCEFLGLGRNAERRIEASIEAHVQFGEVLRKTPSGIRTERIFHGRVHAHRWFLNRSHCTFPFSELAQGATNVLCGGLSPDPSA